MNKYLPFVYANQKEDEFSKFLKKGTSKKYSINVSDFWIYFNVKSQKLPDSGWKGHLAARPEDKYKVFQIAKAVFEANDCSFKVAKNIECFKILNDPHIPVAEANKFITFYPQNINVFKIVIKQLFTKLKNFKAPQIFTDYQLPNNSCVQFRYGAFKKIARWDLKAQKELLYMTLPSGEIIEDSRVGYFDLPEGVEWPFGSTEKWLLVPEKNISKQSKLNSYSFIEIMAQKNKGDVYLGVENVTGKQVIIKSANPYVKNDCAAYSAKELLRNENQMLRNLSNLNVIPKVKSYFNENNIEFQVTEFIDGKSLDSFFGKEKLLSVILSICNTIRLIHEAGYIIGDVTNSNFIYKDGITYLVDLEYVRKNANKKYKRTFKTPYYVPNYSTKTFLTQKEDLFSLGIIIITLTLGKTPKYNSENLNDAVRILINQNKLASKLNPQFSAFLDIAKYILSLSIDPNPYVSENLNQNKIKDIYKYGFYVDSIKDFDTSLLMNSLEELPKQLKKSDYKIGEKWWKSKNFGQYVSELSIQHGISGVDTALKVSAEKLPIKQKVLDISNNFEYGDSYLFGSTGLIWNLIALFKEKEIDSSTLRNEAKKIILSWPEKKEVNDFVLGVSGKAYTLLYLNLLLKDASFSKELKKLGEKIFESFYDIDFETTNFSRINFAHGSVGKAYVLYLLGCYFKNRDFKSKAQLELKKADKIVDRSININKSFFSDSLKYSWCEGLAGIAFGFNRIELLSHGKIKFSSLSKIISFLSKGFCTIEACFCHGRQGILNTIFEYNQYHEKHFSKLDDLLQYDLLNFFNPSSGEWNILDETGYENAMDYGVGQLGVIVIDRMVFRKGENPFFIPIESEMTL